MRILLRGVLLALLWGLAGAVAVLVAGMIWIELVQRWGQPEGSSQMGRAILVGYFLVPAGFVIGVLAGAITVWRARR